MGVLDIGDKLPTVKEVAAEVAINPNTVMKAYWQLEHEGLEEGRQGVGTFVSRRPSGPPPDTQARLARRLERWVRTARHEGFDDESIESMMRSTLSGSRVERTASACATYRRSTRPGWASASAPTGRCRTVGCRCRVVMSQRWSVRTGWETRPCSSSSPAVCPECGWGRGAWSGTRQSEEFLASIGYLAQDVPLYKRLSADDHLEVGAPLYEEGPVVKVDCSWGTPPSLRCPG